jgi:hypothetical protein
MFNTTTRSFTCADYSGSFGWIVDGVEPEQIDASRIEAMADQAISQTAESDTNDVESSAYSMTFPKFGYTTAHVYQDAEDYIDQKKDEIASDLAAERSEIIAFLNNWKNN